MMGDNENEEDTRFGKRTRKKKRRRDLTASEAQVGKRN